MKNKPILYLLVLTMITACQKHPVEINESKMSSNIDFEKSFKTIDKFFDELDSSSTPSVRKTQIVCKDFSDEYKNNYIPAALKIEGNNFTEQKLLDDLDIAINYYKEKYNIQC